MTEEQRKKAIEEFLRKRAQQNQVVPCSRTRCSDVVSIELTPTRKPSEDPK